MITGIVDFHTHLLPDIDDGVQKEGLDEALEMLRSEIGQGVTDVVCTSHYGEGNMGEVDYDRVEQQFFLLEQAVREQKLPVKLYPGAELFGPDNAYILDRLCRKKCHTIAGTEFILVEFAEWADAKETAGNITGRMIALAKEGTYRPILAHAERYRDFRGKEEKYDEMLRAGVRLQINLFDVCENKDPWVTGVTQQLLSEEKVFVTGTDTHGYKRVPRITSGAEWIRGHCSGEYAGKVLRDNAMSILSGGF